MQTKSEKSLTLAKSDEWKHNKRKQSHIITARAYVDQVYYHFQRKGRQIFKSAIEDLPYSWV